MFVFSWTPEQREEWMDESLCAEVDGDLWFPEIGDPGTAAKKICASCDVREKCLEYAVRTRQEYGVWGGMSTKQRKKLWDDNYVPVPANKLDEAKFRYYYGQGLKDTEIAVQMGCSQGGVQRFRKRLGLKPNHAAIISKKSA